MSSDKIKKASSDSIQLSAAYVILEPGGISYQRTLDGSRNRRHSTPTLLGSVLPDRTLAKSTARRTGVRLATTSFGTIVKEMNRANKTVPFVWMPIVVGTGLTVLLMSLPVIVPLFSLGITLIISWLYYQRDEERCRFHLIYGGGSSQEKSWKLHDCSTFLDGLSRSDRIWYIPSDQPSSEGQATPRKLTGKTNRKTVSLAVRAPDRIRSNILPYCLDIHEAQLYFYPDGIYVLKNGVFQAISYDRLELTVHPIRFQEEGVVPDDSAITSHKSGKGELPTVLYGMVEFRAGSDLNVTLLVSSWHAVEELPWLFHLFRGTFKNVAASPSGTRKQSTPQTTANSSPKRAPQGQEGKTEANDQTGVKSTIVEEYYLVLGLSPGCSQQEASARYRELAKANHPDRVHHMSEADRERATRTLAEINAAYTRLKQERDW